MNVDGHIAIPAGLPITTCAACRKRGALVADGAALVMVDYDARTGVPGEMTAPPLATGGNCPRAGGGTGAANGCPLLQMQRLQQQLASGAQKRTKASPARKEAAHVTADVTR